MAINNRIVFFLMMMIGMMGIANGIICEYDATPLIKGDIKWTCHNVSSDYCMSYVEYSNSSLLQLNPVPKKIDDVGIIDKFEVKNKMVNIYFRKDLLRDNKWVLFGVSCENESFVANVTPQYKVYYNLIDRVSWARENAGYIIGFVIIIIAILIFLRWAWKQRK